jgi:hypothetical protein
MEEQVVDEEEGDDTVHVLSLPCDIILQLISCYLPIPTVLAFLCVCKDLASLNKPSFWYSYLHFHCKVLSMKPERESPVWKELGLKVVKQTTMTYVPVFGKGPRVGDHTDFMTSNLVRDGKREDMTRGGYK